jgi:hypothetical protein
LIRLADIVDLNQLPTHSQEYYWLELRKHYLFVINPIRIKERSIPTNTDSERRDDGQITSIQSNRQGPIYCTEEAETLISNQGWVMRRLRSLPTDACVAWLQANS